MGGYNAQGNHTPFLILAAAMAAALLVSTPANALFCGDAEKILTGLQAKFNERPTWGGIPNRALTIVMTISDTGTWSLLEFLSPTRVCVIRSGANGHFYQGKPPKIYKPGTAPS